MNRATPVNHTRTSCPVTAHLQEKHRLCYFLMSPLNYSFPLCNYWEAPIKSLRDAKKEKRNLLTLGAMATIWL